MLVCAQKLYHKRAQLALDTVFGLLRPKSALKLPDISLLAHFCSISRYRDPVLCIFMILEHILTKEHQCATMCSKVTLKAVSKSSDLCIKIDYFQCNSNINMRPEPGTSGLEKTATSGELDFFSRSS